MQNTSLDYDYIILGAGLSGLMLAKALVSDPYFKDKSILILDKSEKNTNDRTWCFWSENTQDWDAIISKKWESILFKGENVKVEIPLKNYSYNRIEGFDFYESVFKILSASKQVTFKTEAFQNLTETESGVEVTTSQKTYTATQVFSSILPPERLKNQTQFPVLQQHFIGWEVRTQESVFNPEVATFMDFSIPQSGNTRFMYVLPTAVNKALVEYTLFSEKLLPKAEYEAAIKDYMEALGASEYEVTATEQGCIPMTAYSFEQHNSTNLMHIGTAGGWTRGSTGYTFTYTLKRTTELIDFLKRETDLRKFNINDRYRWYDKLFLDVLYRNNEQGAALFTHMFQKNDIAKIFRFLDGTSSLKEDFQIIWSLPKKEFIKSFFHIK
ncbi:lycopene cyclase family protein [Leeuwenhoekiella marinoflava]|uniref:Lycopene beta-cyclase n=2 Tax=Leeuwenhoekiella marinoflava TaxID=988 RepID=A0A4Q0PC84_9FLAO|nr:lycopene cyclase family protein [Leeuwenhoekiella marinoflava]RXG24158.1 lycopene beta-cyclase [Leeuwenhoekiella marinoflava]SHF92811.1 lycopene beta-cyclase [Leeuwenhoekiella marinoflava DSM 3653]